MVILANGIFNYFSIIYIYSVTFLQNFRNNAEKLTIWRDFEHLPLYQLEFSTEYLTFFPFNQVHPNIQGKNLYHMVFMKVNILSFKEMYDKRGLGKFYSSDFALEVHHWVQISGFLESLKFLIISKPCTSLNDAVENSFGYWIISSYLKELRCKVTESLSLSYFLCRSSQFCYGRYAGGSKIPFFPINKKHIFMKCFKL